MFMGMFIISIFILPMGYENRGSKVPDAVAFEPLKLSDWMCAWEGAFFFFDTFNMYDAWLVVIYMNLNNQRKTIVCAWFSPYFPLKSSVLFTSSHVLRQFV